MEHKVPDFSDFGVLRKRNRLVSHITEVFSRNVDHRRQSGSDELLNKAMMAWAREPDESEKQMFARLGVRPNTYDSLTRWKGVSVIAVLNRVFGQPGQKSWSIEPTPIPDVPESVTNEALMRIMQEFLQMATMQAQMQGEEPQIDPQAAMQYGASRMGEIMREQVEWAKERADRMELMIDDILFEDNFTNKTLRPFIVNLVKFGTGVIIGPCVESAEMLEMKTSKHLGQVEYKLKVKPKLTYFTPSTIDCYPSPGALMAEDGDLCVKVYYSNNTLSMFAEGAATGKRVKGWDASAVKRVLEKYPFGGVSVDGNSQTGERQLAEGQPIPGDTRMIEGVRWFGHCPGEYLLECGVTEDFDKRPIKKHSYYEMDCVVIADELVCCRVCDPAIGRPVVKTTFYGDDSRWFGWTLASQIENCQALMNIAVAGLKKQIQMSSGPSFVFNDVDSFVNSNTPGYFTFAPWKTFLRKSNPFQTATAANSAPIMPIQVPTTITEILRLFEAIGNLTDDQSGFSRNMFGSGSFAGAARTARGLQRIQESANIVADFVIANVDATSINPLLGKTVRWINMRHENETVKGDVDIVARGALGMALKSTEQEALSAAFNVANTGMAPQIIGPKGLMEILRQLLGSMNIGNIDKVIPSEQRMEFLELMQNIQQMQAAEQGEQARQQGELEAAQTQQEMAMNQAEYQQDQLEPLGGVEERRGVA